MNYIGLNLWGSSYLSVPRNSISIFLCYAECNIELVFSYFIGYISESYKPLIGVWDISNPASFAFNDNFSINYYKWAISLSFISINTRSSLAI